MYPVSSQYKTAIRQSVRTDRVTGTLTLTDGAVLALTAADLISGSLTLDNQCVNGEELEFGCVYLGQASLQLRTALSRYAFYGASLTLAYGLLLPDGSWETVPLGVYTVAEAERRAISVSIKAYDNMLLLDTPYDGEVLQGTAYEMLSQIAKKAGLALGQTEAELAALGPNAALSRQLDSSYGVSTLRDCAAAVAQLLAGFATVDRAGQLVIRRFAADPCLTLTPGQRSETALSDFSCRYAALHLETAAGTVTAAAEDADGLSMTMDNVPLAENGTEEMRQSICSGIFAVLQQIRYTPATVTMPGDPSLDLGDRITLPLNGTSAETLVTHLVWKYRGRQTLRGVGKNPHLNGTSSRTETKLRQLEQQTQAGKIIFYSFTNTRDLTATGSRETRAANLTFATTRDTSALFLAQALLTAAPDTDEPLTLTVQYYLDDVLLADFAPVQSLAAGSHILTLFYPFAQLTGPQLYRWSVRMTCAGGKVTIPAGQLKATISGQGMAGTTAWDGTLTCEDTLPPFAVLRPARTLQAMAEAMQAAAQYPAAARLTEALAPCPVVRRGLIYYESEA